MDYLLALRDWIQHVWVDYRFGTIFALISMVLVVVTYIRLARQFALSNNKLKVWPRLLGHALWRVLLTVCVYFGPVWTVERILDALVGTWNGIVVFFDFVSQADRLTVILMTTVFVLSVFVVVTATASYQYLRKKYAAWRQRKREQDRDGQ